MAATRFAAAGGLIFEKNRRTKTAQIHSIYYITFPAGLSRGLGMFLEIFLFPGLVPGLFLLLSPFYKEAAVGFFGGIRKLRLAVVVCFYKESAFCFGHLFCFLQ